DLGWNCMKSSSFGRIIHRVEQVAQEVKLIATLEMVNTKGPTQQLGIHPGVEQLKMRFRNNTAGKIMIRLIKDASVNVGPDWKVLEEIEFNWPSLI
ncbi:9167_t:CDS:2, partial [Rhizophagus irregularis]